MYIVVKRFFEGRIYEVICFIVLLILVLLNKVLRVVRNCGKIVVYLI